MQQYALVLGIEHYLDDQSLASISYAGNDVKDFAAALENLGYSVELLVNRYATAGRIRSALKQLVVSDGQIDSLILFFVGHCAVFEGKSYLFGSDADPRDISATALPLAKLFHALEQAKAGSTLIFLDTRNLSPSKDCFDQSELDHFLEPAADTALFTACSSSETSWSSLEFQHGYWTHCLLRVLQGKEPAVLRENIIYAYDIQRFTENNVKRQMALQRQDGQLQTPRLWCRNPADFAIADLSNLASSKPRHPRLAGLKRAAFERVETGRVKNLSGFVKGGFLPKFVSHSGTEFVVKASATELKTEMDSVFHEVQRSKRYKNRDIRFDCDGAGSIRTPDFHYSVEFRQSPDDAVSYTVTKSLDNVVNPELLKQEWFTRCFGGKFDSVVLIPEKAFSIDDLIDAAEEVEGVEVTTDPERSHCVLEFASWQGRVRVDPHQICFDFGSLSSPSEMLENVQSVLKALAGVPPMAAFLTE